MATSKTGKVVIIVNGKALSNGIKFKSRPGSDKDIENLKAVFVDQFELQWTNEDKHKDLKITEWNHKYRIDLYEEDPDCPCIVCHIKNLQLGDSEIFVLAISTHGESILTADKQERMYVKFSDGMYASMADIIGDLSDKQCPSLKGKQRVLLIQACRYTKGNKDKRNDEGLDILVGGDEGGEDSESGSDSDVSGTDADNADEDAFKDQMLPHMYEALVTPRNDFLIAYGATPWRYSKRNTKNGAWMISELKNALDAWPRDKPVNLLSLLLITNARVSKKETKSKKEKKARQKSCFSVEHRLRSNIILNLKHIPEVKLF